MTEQVAKGASGLRAIEQPRRESVRRDEVPVAAAAGLHERCIRPLVVEQAHRDEEGAVRQPALRPAHGAPQTGLEARSESPRPGCERRRAVTGPHGCQLSQPLPDDGLRMQAVDRVRDVG